MEIRTYSELIRFPTFIDRYNYLKLGDRIGEETFGFDRYLNQKFYKSKEWQDIRNYIITRDLDVILQWTIEKFQEELKFLFII